MTSRLYEFGRGLLVVSLLLSLAIIASTTIGRTAWIEQHLVGDQVVTYQSADGPVICLRATYPDYVCTWKAR